MSTPTDTYDISNLDFEGLTAHIASLEAQLDAANGKMYNWYLRAHGWKALPAIQTPDDLYNSVLRGPEGPEPEDMEHLTYSQIVQWWYEDAKRNGATVENLPEGIRKLAEQVYPGDPHGFSDNLKPILEGWQKLYRDLVKQSQTGGTSNE